MACVLWFLTCYLVGNVITLHTSAHIVVNPGANQGGHVVQVPEASACAGSGSVSGLVSAPSCPGLGSRPWTSSFTVYTNNSIYKEITPEEKKTKNRRGVTNLWLWPFFCHTCLLYLYLSCTSSTTASSIISCWGSRQSRSIHKNNRCIYFYFIAKTWSETTADTCFIAQKLFTL